MAKRNRTEIQADALRILEQKSGGIQWADLIALVHADDPETPRNSVRGALHKLLTTDPQIEKIARGTYRLKKFVDKNDLSTRLEVSEETLVEVDSPEIGTVQVEKLISTKVSPVGWSTMLKR